MKKDIHDLLDLMAKLRDPEKGCVWDKQQTYQSIVPHTLEEAYEVTEVIEKQQYDELCGELGDLLFQVVFYAQIASEENRFDFHDVVDQITLKMIRRHPHVFADVSVDSVEEQKKLWDEIKQQEKGADDEKQNSFLNGVNWHLPALTVAKKLQNKAAKTGFDWPQWQGAAEKILEELDELKEAVEEQHTAENIQGEMGDILFAAVNLSRLIGVDPDAALRQTNRKFDQRFRRMEEFAAEDGHSFDNLSLQEQENYWQKVKRESQD